MEKETILKVSLFSLFILIVVSFVAYISISSNKIGLLEEENNVMRKIIEYDTKITLRYLNLSKLSEEIYSSLYMEETECYNLCYSECYDTFLDDWDMGCYDRCEIECFESIEDISEDEFGELKEKLISDIDDFKAILYRYEIMFENLDIRSKIRWLDELKKDLEASENLYFY